jgi:hypothetical protein
MWAIGSACPDFRVRTPAGPLDPAALHGTWVALLHCTRPCTPGCGVCLERFGHLGARLTVRGCRLLVALDEPDAPLRARLGQQVADRQASVTFGTWETHEPPHRASTLFAVIDPDGIVRSLSDGPNATPLSERTILDAVDRALGRTLSPPRGTASPADRLGCVEWFDYDAARARPADAP